MNETRRQRKYRQRREAIIEAARKVFERKGYERASIGEIAGEADFAKGSIYYYFDNKAALLDAVIGDEIEKIRTLFQGSKQKSGNPVESLASVIREILGFYQRNFALFRIVTAPMTALEVSETTDEASSLHQRYLDLFQRTREKLTTLIGEAQQKGMLLSAVAADEAADLLHGLINAEVHRWDQAGRKEKLAEKDTLVMGLFLNGCASPSESGSQPAPVASKR